MLWWIARAYGVYALWDSPTHAHTLYIYIYMIRNYDRTYRRPFIRRRLASSFGVDVVAVAQH